MNHSPPLREQLKSLERLQEVDLKVLSLEKQKKELPLQLSRLEQQLQAIAKSITEVENKLNDARKVLRQTEAAIDLNQDRLGRTSKKLEDVGNTKEFQAATREMDQLKKQSDELSSQKEKAQTELQTVEKTVQEWLEKKSALQNERDQKATEIQKLVSEVDSSLGLLLTERGQYTDGIEKTVLARYDRVRRVRDGLGIAPAVSGRCKVCNVVLSPQLYNRLFRGDELLECPSCQRMLFLPGEVLEQLTSQRSGAETKVQGQQR